MKKSFLKIFIFIPFTFFFFSACSQNNQKHHKLPVPSSGSPGTVFRYSFKLNKDFQEKFKKRNELLRGLIPGWHKINADIRLYYKKNEEEIVQEVRYFYIESSSSKKCFLLSSIPQTLIPGEHTVDFKIGKDLLTTFPITVTQEPLQPEIVFFRPKSFQKNVQSKFCIKPVNWIRDKTHIIAKQGDKQFRTKLKYPHYDLVEGICGEETLFLTFKGDIPITLDFTGFEPGKAEIYIETDSNGKKILSKSFSINILKQKKPRIVRVIVSKSAKGNYDLMLTGDNFSDARQGNDIFMDGDQLFQKFIALDIQGFDTNKLKTVFLNVKCPDDIKEGKHTVQVQVKNLKSNEKTFDIKEDKLFK